MPKTSKAAATPEEKAKRKEQAAEKKQREHAEFIAGVNSDLEASRAAVTEIEQKLGAARENAATFKALVSHLNGFYQEIDKLSKNKGVFEATDLVVEAINDIVRDAKRFAAGDPYLNRTKGVRSGRAKSALFGCAAGGAGGSAVPAALGAGDS